MNTIFRASEKNKMLVVLVNEKNKTNQKQQQQKANKKKLVQTPEFSSVRMAKTFNFTVYKTEVLRQMLR